jgi:hypothetical protein
LKIHFAIQTDRQLLIEAEATIGPTILIHISPGLANHVCVSWDRLVLYEPHDMNRSRKILIAERRDRAGRDKESCVRQEIYFVSAECDAGKCRTPANTGGASRPRINSVTSDKPGRASMSLPVRGVSLGADAPNRIAISQLSE